MKKFTTSRGIEIEFRPVSKGLLLRFNAANPQPQPPTYEVKSAITGTTEQIALDEKSIREKPEQFTEKNLADWRAYSEKQAQYAERLLRFCCLRGIRVDVKITPEWLDEQAASGIPVPESESERRYAWIVSEVIGNDTDITAILAGVMETLGADSDLQAQVGELFPGDVPGNSAESVGDAAEQMAGVPTLARSESDASPPSHAERMGKSKRARPRVDVANPGDYRGDGVG